MTALNRRTFLHTATTAAAGVCLHRTLSAQAAPHQSGSAVITLPLATFPFMKIQEEPYITYVLLKS